MIIGIDPGKSGGFCALDEGGKVLSTDIMPTDKSGICPVGIAQIYSSYREMMEFDEPVNVFIEKIFTMPTDAVSQKDIDGHRKLRLVVEAYLDASEGGFCSEAHFEALKHEYELCPKIEQGVRVDGRVGNLNYARGAGLLEMCAMWQWPITRVSPRTWGKVIKDGISKKLDSKAQSIEAAKALWPDMFRVGGFYVSDRSKKPHDGLVEAALIAEYGKQKLAREKRPA